MSTPPHLAETSFHVPTRGWAGFSPSARPGAAQATSTERQYAENTVIAGPSGDGVRSADEHAVRQHRPAEHVELLVRRGAGAGPKRGRLESRGVSYIRT